MYPKIDIYNNFSYILRRKNVSITVWILFLILSMIIFIIIAFNYKFHLYKNYLGYVRDDNVVLYVEEDKIDSLYNSKLIVDNLKYEFKIINISEEYYLSDNKKCREVVISFLIKNEFKIENNILNLTFESDLTTIYDELKKGIKTWIK